MVGDTDAESSANGLLVNMVHAQRLLGPDTASDIVVSHAGLATQASPPSAPPSATLAPGDRAGIIRPLD